MALGLLIHAANPYVASEQWIVRGQGDLVALDFVQGMFHQFRMPGFFLISGLLSMLALRKRGTADFVGRRAFRLMVPFVVMLATFNLLQLLFVRHYVATHCAGNDACPVQAIPGLWVAHLWFLVFLLLYTFVLVAVAPLLQGVVTRLQRWLPGIAMLAGLVVFVAGALLVAKGLASAMPGFYEKILGVGSVYDFIGFLGFFLAGAMLACAADARLRALDFGLPVFLGLLLVGAASYAWATGTMAHALPHSPLRKLGELALMVSQIALTLSGIRLCMLLGKAAPKLGKALLEASYSVYLFHHFVVVLVAAALITVAMNPWLKFLLTMTTAGVVSLLLHYLVIARWSLAAFLFNGTGAASASKPR